MIRSESSYVRLGSDLRQAAVPVRAFTGRSGGRHHRHRRCPRIMQTRMTQSTALRHQLPTDFRASASASWYPSRQLLSAVGASGRAVNKPPASDSTIAILGCSRLEPSARASG